MADKATKAAAKAKKTLKYLKPVLLTDLYAKLATGPVNLTTRPTSPPEAESMPTEETNNSRGVRFTTGTKAPSTDHRREFMRYVDLQFDVPKAVGLANGTSVARSAVSRLLQSLKDEVDINTVLYTYVQTDPLLELDACTSADSLPTTTTKLNKLLNNFKPRTTGGRVFVQARIGMTEEPKDFIRSAREVLKEINASMYDKALQEPHTTCVGWLLYSDQEMQAEYWVAYFLRAFHVLADRQYPDGGPECEAMKAVKIGLQFKYIWDGSNKSDRPASYKGVRALHVEFTKDQAIRGLRMIREVLAQDNNMCNINMRIVPLFQKTSGGGLKDKIRAAIELHRKAGLSLMSTTNHDCVDMDREISAIGLSLRDLIMRMTTVAGDPTVFRISPDWTDSGGYTFTFARQREIEAHEQLDCLGVLLARQYGPAIYARFTAEATARFEDMVEDPATGKPASRSEMALATSVSDGNRQTWIDISMISALDAEAARAEEIVRPARADEEWDTETMTTFHVTEAGEDEAAPRSRRRSRRPRASSAGVKVQPHSDTDYMMAMDTSIADDDQSEISDTSTLSRATMATMVTNMHLNNSRFQNEMRTSMTEQFSNLLAQLQAAAIQPGNTQASPTRTASPGEVPFSTEEPPPGSSAL
jgi:hypothetical protein